MCTQFLCKIQTGLWKSYCVAGRALRHVKLTGCLAAMGVYGNEITSIGQFAIKAFRQLHTLHPKESSKGTSARLGLHHLRKRRRAEDRVNNSGGGLETAAPRPTATALPIRRAAAQTNAMCSRLAPTWSCPRLPLSTFPVETSSHRTAEN